MSDNTGTKTNSASEFSHPAENLPAKTPEVVTGEIVEDKKTTETVDDGSIYTAKEKTQIDNVNDFLASVVGEKSKDLTDNRNVRLGIEAGQALVGNIHKGAENRVKLKSSEDEKDSAARVATAIENISGVLTTAVKKDIKLPGDLEIDDSDLVKGETSAVGSENIQFEDVVKEEEV